ncbi:hypothetical protein D5085_08615 [Ectothiorhodospiraceae bacterium BW-2]|nr:hypothetical protein D5085_08615 [Ectothiorhodospiraceae bacterium BW-2]
MIVKLKAASRHYPELSAGYSYFVIGIEADDYRLLNDKGSPYLYPAELFDIVEATEPVEWLTEYGADGERYAYPAPLHEIGFFEDFFDQKPEQVIRFWHTVNQQLTRAA